MLAKKQLANNIDPSEHKKEQKLKNSVNAEDSFKNIAIEWHNNQKQGWRERMLFMFLGEWKLTPNSPLYWAGVCLLMTHEGADNYKKTAILLVDFLRFQNLINLY